MSYKRKFKLSIFTVIGSSFALIFFLIYIGFSTGLFTKTGFIVAFFLVIIFFLLSIFWSITEFRKIFRISKIQEYDLLQKEVEIFELDKKNALNQKVESLMLDLMPQLVWKTDSEGNVDYFNKKWMEYTGEDFNHSKDLNWLNILHPDDREKTREKWMESVKTGKPYQVEYRLKRADGQYKWFLARGNPLKDEEGTIIKWMGACTNIEDQKNAEHKLESFVAERTRKLKLINEELKRSNQDLEQFAYVASHDLQEPLRKILAFGERLTKKYEDELQGQGVEYISRMQNASQRMQKLINDLLIYSRVSRSKDDFELVDLNQLLNDVLEDLDEVIREKQVQININDLPELKGNPVQLRQLFQNIISNAIKFNRPDVTPEVTIYNNKFPDKKTLKQYNLNLKYKYVQITIEDNGIGFDTQYLDKIFTIFQRLHGRSEYSGTGIGLAVCRKVIENHHGYITAESSVGKGARFIIILPLNFKK